jgi:hypothetical protein
VDNEKLKQLVTDSAEVLVDSLKKDFDQYEAEAELWNGKIQSELADSVANKISTILLLNKFLMEQG